MWRGRACALALMRFDYKLDWALRTLNESTGLDVLYHGVPVSKLPTILRDGLDPSFSIHADDEEMNGYPDFGPPFHFIYLSDNLRVARSFAPGGENYTSNEPGALLEIRLPPALRSRLVLDRGEFIRAPFVIPPQYIRVMDESEWSGV